MYFSTLYPSPVGNITLACDNDSLVGLWIARQKYHGNTLSQELVEKDNMPAFALTKKWLDHYFAGEKLDISGLPLAPIGGDFRQKVWSILCAIPYGEVITYGDIAKKMAVQMNRKSMSSQAVGGAIGHNPISILIPCHRVVGSDGSLTGYAGGIDTKMKLLELERVDLSTFFVPKNESAL